MIQDYPVILLRCLLITLICEETAAFFIGLRRRDLLYVLFVNAITNPIVVFSQLFTWLYFGRTASNIILLTLEISAFLLEGFIYKRHVKTGKIHGFLLSLILNAVSYSIGFLINFF